MSNPVDPELQGLRYEASEARQAAMAAESLILHALSGSPDLPLFAYTTTHRTKGEYRIIEKVREQRSRRDNDVTFNPINLPDLCGFRIITLFQSSIIDAIDYIIGLIRHDDKYGLSPFIKDSLNGIVIYSSRPAHDPLSFYTLVGEPLQKRSLAFTLAQSSDLFSSVHIYMRCRVSIDDPSRPGAKKIMTVNTEFQLRSVFEEAWGQISWKLRHYYVRSPSNPEIWHKHLGVLKAILDGCIQYAQLIKETCDEPESRHSAIKVTSSRSTQDAPTEMLRRFVGIPMNIYKRIETAYQSLEKMAAITSVTERPRKFLEAASLFQMAADDAVIYEASFAQPDMYSEVLYQMRMECAWCLYSAYDPVRGNKDDLQKAAHIYVDVQRERKDDATSRFRLGQVYNAQESYERAEEVLNECIQILDRHSDPNIPSEHWMHGAVRRALGVTRWQQSKQCVEEDESSREKRLRYFEEAVKLTRDAYARANVKDEKIICINNMTYYGWYERDNRYDYKTISDEEVDECIKQLLEIIKEQSANEVLPNLDSVCRALVIRDRMDDAAQPAHKIVNLLRSKVLTLAGKSGMDPSMQRMFSDDNLLRSHLSSIEYGSYTFASWVLMNIIDGALRQADTGAKSVV